MSQGEKVNHARRGFLRGKFSASAAPRRPPWALAEPEFLNACQRCDECVKACPAGILRSVNGYPVIDFGKGACSFCGECVSRCPSGALRRTEHQAPWSLRARVGPTCLALRQIECRVCGEHCDAAAIRLLPRLGGPSAPEISAAACTGCGACVSPCPAAAISME